MISRSKVRAKAKVSSSPHRGWISFLQKPAFTGVPNHSLVSDGELTCSILSA